MKQPQLAYIISLPRSGSTVLSALLDRRRGFVSPPESSFPQVLSIVTEQERRDHRWMAALYIGATFPPTQLSLADAAECMGGTDEEILVKLGWAVAEKLGRQREEIDAVVWKTPRTVGMHAAPLATSGKVIVLRRNPHNVFESQFRVGFGEKNRNPYRFAIFRESYEHAFAQVPEDRKFDVHYDDLPEAVDAISNCLGVPIRGDWPAGPSSLDLAAENCGWLSEVTSEFQNRDPEKRSRLDPAQVAQLERAMKLARPLRPFLGPVRAYFDRQSLGPIRERAKAALAAASRKDN